MVQPTPIQIDELIADRQVTPCFPPERYGAQGRLSGRRYPNPQWGQSELTVAVQLFFGMIKTTINVMMLKKNPSTANSSAL